MKKTDGLSIRAVFYKTSSCWVAQCLEYDIVAQGRTLFDAQESFKRAFLTNIIVNVKNGIKPLSQFKKAPKRFFDMFNDRG